MSDERRAAPSSSRAPAGGGRAATGGMSMSEAAAMGVTMTERAAQHVAGYLAKRGRGIGLRLGVRTTGCSGMAYKLEYADVAQPEDRQFESHGVKIFVDPKSLAYIDGTELDFAREGLERRIQVQQPEGKEPLRLR